MFGVLIINALFFVIIVIILVGLWRWIFRINDIVERLDKIIELLTSKNGESK
jgi:sensor histidine kinase YesM